MIGETPVTVVGNLTDDPELRYTPTGVPVASFTVASTERRYDQQTGRYEDAGTLFIRCNVWRELAENLAESAVKGTRVMVTGALKQRSWEQDGQKRSTFEIQGTEVGISLRWATAKPVKARRSGAPVPEDPWARQPAAGQAGNGGDGTPPEPDEPPF